MMDCLKGRGWLMARYYITYVISSDIKGSLLGCLNDSIKSSKWPLNAHIYYVGNIPRGKL